MSGALSIIGQGVELVEVLADHQREVVAVPVAQDLDHRQLRRGRGTDAVALVRLGQARPSCARRRSA